MSRKIDFDAQEPSLNRRESLSTEDNGLMSLFGVQISQPSTNLLEGFIEEEKQDPLVLEKYMKQEMECLNGVVE